MAIVTKQHRFHDCYEEAWVAWTMRSVNSFLAQEAENYTE